MEVSVLEGIAGGVGTILCGAIGKLFYELQANRKERYEDIRAKDAEIAQLRKDYDLEKSALQKELRENILSAGKELREYMEKNTIKVTDALNNNTAVLGAAVAMRKGNPQSD